MGIPIRYTDQPITYAVAAIVAAGQFVDADQAKSLATGQAFVVPSAAASKLAIGVALRTAAPAGTTSPTDAAARPPNTTVARRGCVVPVTFAAASTFGDRLKTALTGKVEPIVTTTSPEVIVAVNVTDAGHTAATAVGYVQIEV